MLGQLNHLACLILPVSILGFVIHLLLPQLLNRYPKMEEYRIERLDSNLDSIIPVGAKVETIAEGFGFTEGTQWVHDEEGRSTARGCMYGVVGAVDGLFVETEAPAATESLSTTEYYADQKKAYGLNVQAIASADYRFIAVSIKCPGAVNDFSAFTRSRAWELTRRLRAGFFTFGDAAYPLDGRLLTPYPGKKLSEEYDVFNFYHSQQRMVVEQSFGILVQTWGILWKSLRLGFHGRADVINAIFRLHNFLRDEGVNHVTPTDDDGSRDDDSPELDSDGVLPEEYRTQNEGTPKRSGEVQRRADIRQALKDLGLIRPEHNVSRNANLG